MRERPTGRGSLEENDEPQGRKVAEAGSRSRSSSRGRRSKLNEEQTRNNPSVIPAAVTGQT